MRSPRLHPYAAAVLATVRRRRLLSPEERVLVALSAGPDSTALVAALAELRDAGLLCRRGLAALHVDHGLRPGGADDAAAAARTCAALGVAFESVAVSVRPGNVQAEARRARYAALRAAARRGGAERIATGHTRTDQAETVLLRLLRGAGARGLGAIPPRRGAVVRPLIDRSRDEGLAYLASRGLGWRDDPSNATPRYARNRVRLALWPAVTALAPAAERALARAADLARDDDRALSRAALALVPEGASVELARLRSAARAVRRRVVRVLWRRAAAGRAALSLEHVDAVLALSRRTRPGRRALPGGLEARCRYGRLEVGPPAAIAAMPAERDVPAPGRYALPELGLEVEVRAANPAALPWPLALRPRRTGDYIRPEGGAGTKRLARWLIDRKVPRERRDGLVVLAAGQRILAVPELGVTGSVPEAPDAGLSVRLRPLR